MSEFSDDDVINASTEDAARTHSSAVSALYRGIQKRVQGNEALRHSLSIAKARTTSFEELERRIQRGSRDNVSKFG
jgi:hypothetical protein